MNLSLLPEILRLVIAQREREKEGVEFLDLGYLRGIFLIKYLKQFKNFQKL